MLAINTSMENIGVAMCHAAMDPGLASLSFRHVSAEMLVQGQK